jgi:hypothetical protein
MVSVMGSTPSDSKGRAFTAAMRMGKSHGISARLPKKRHFARHVHCALSEARDEDAL